MRIKVRCASNNLKRQTKKVIPLLLFLGDLKKFLDPRMIVIERHKHFENEEREKDTEH